MSCAGSYKQYIVSPERYTTLIPDGVSDYVAGPAMCSAATTYSSLKEAGLRPGNFAVFPGGGGGVGIQGVQLAAAMGLRPIVVDTGDARAELTKKYGAEHFVDFKKGDPVEEVIKLTGGGAHAVFVTAVQAYPLSPKYLGSRAGAVVMCIGLPPAGQFHIDLDPTTLIFRNQSIKGTLVSSLGDLDETLEFAARGEMWRPVACQDYANSMQENSILSRRLWDLASGTIVYRNSSGLRLLAVLWLTLTSHRHRYCIARSKEITTTHDPKSPRLRHQLHSPSARPAAADLAHHRSHLLLVSPCISLSKLKIALPLTPPLSAALPAHDDLIKSLCVFATCAASGLRGGSGGTWLTAFT